MDSESRITIRHTKDARNRLENAHRVLGIANRLSDQLEDIFNHWSRVPIRDTEVRKLVELAMVPPKETVSSIGEHSLEEFSSYHRRVCDTVFEYAMTSPTQQSDTVRCTLFGAYNGITGYFQNVRSYRTPEDKMNSLLYSGLAEQRSRKAFRLCENFAAKGILLL